MGLKAALTIVEKGSSIVAVDSPSVVMPSCLDVELHSCARWSISGAITIQEQAIHQLWCRLQQVADIEKAEKDKMKGKVEKIVGHGINCFINRQLIYNYPEELFADAGVMAIEHADFDGIERLGLVTGAFLTAMGNAEAAW